MCESVPQKLGHTNVHISNQHTTSLGTLFYQGYKVCISSKKKDDRNSLWSLKAITALI